MRLRHLDFLRGIAVLLVLLRHYALSYALYDVGWVGVDLFFVLSGFLVSSLLFNEYKKYNNIKPGLFLIRRGFKIYPLFYAAVILYLIFILVKSIFGASNGDLIDAKELFSEIFFVQNYFYHIWEHTWSLAIEEHFYFSLVVIVFFLSKKKLLDNKKLFIGFFLFVAVTCLVLRIINYINVPFDNQTHVYPTHLRIDSLMFGVFLSYLYSYSRDKYLSFFNKNKHLMLAAGLILASSCIFFRIETFFMNTFGLTFLYLGFGLILSVMVAADDVDKTMNKFFGRWTVDIVAKIGFYSYSIYLWHRILIKYIHIGVDKLFPDGINQQLFFFIYFFSSIFFAIGMSKLIEQQFLKYRDKHFPTRSRALQLKNNTETTPVKP